MSDFKTFTFGDDTLVVHKATGFAALMPTKKEAGQRVDDLLRSLDWALKADAENQRMRAAFKELIATIAKSKEDGDGITFSLSGCEWCGEMWPKVEAQPEEATLEAARYHLSCCEKHPLKQHIAELEARIAGLEK